jgi:TonB-dependent receptor-like protein
MRRWAPLLLLIFAPGLAWAAEPSSEEATPDQLKIYDEIEVTDRASDMLGAADSAGEGVTDSARVRGGDLLAAIEYGTADGPWERLDNFRKHNGVLRWNHGDAGRGFTLTAMGYDGRWSSTDQIPARAVRDGSIGRYGSFDTTDGGRSHRYSLSAELRRGSGSALTRTTAYVARYGLDLFSNFTYFLDDPENGDQFEQTDDRTVAGFQVERQRMSSWRGREVETTFGLQARGDDIANGLFHTRERRRLETTRQDDVQEVLAGPYAQARVRWNPWLRTVAGLRADWFHADVESNLAATSDPVPSSRTPACAPAPRRSSMRGSATASSAVCLWRSKSSTFSTKR